MSDILQYDGNGNLSYFISKGFNGGQYQIHSMGTIDCPDWVDFEHNHFTAGDFDGNGIVDFLFGERMIGIHLSDPLFNRVNI